MANNKRNPMGRGLEALLKNDDVFLEDVDNIDDFVNNTVFKGDITKEVPIKEIFPCDFQPRTEFSEEALQSLSDSIKENGVLQPLLLRSRPNGYEIIAGERRWRAAQKAGLNTVPAIIKELNDQETLEIALIENLQRENLSAIEEAEGFNRLIQNYEYTQDVLGKIVGKSRSYIANILRLLTLPTDVQNLVRENKLSAGHARALVGYPQASDIAKKIIAQDLSVRQTENLVSALKQNRQPQQRERLTDVDLEKIISDLENKLKLKVKINAGKNGKGSVTLKYENPAELSSILDLLEQR